MISLLLATSAETIAFSTKLQAPANAMLIILWSTVRACQLHPFAEFTSSIALFCINVYALDFTLISQEHAFLYLTCADQTKSTSLGSVSGLFSTRRQALVPAAMSLSTKNVRKKDPVKLPSL